MLYIAIVLVGTAALVIAPVARADTAVRPGYWVGRTDESSGGFSWPGSGLAFRFAGSRLDVVLEDTGQNSLTIERDGIAYRLDLIEGTHTYTLAEGLDHDIHEVRLTRRTEALFGPTVFEEARTDGRFLAIDPPDRQIVVIGDSISTGYGIEGQDHTCSFSPDTQNQYLTYASVAGRRLGAEVTTLAASGKGVARNIDGSTRATMPELIDFADPLGRVAAGTEEPRADVVVINLGTNDFSTQSDTIEFVASYVGLLSTLRHDHPKAVVYATIGPMLMPNVREDAFAAIQKAVAQRHVAGDRLVTAFVFPSTPDAFGCDWHPNAEAHAVMADAFVEKLEQDLGWHAP